MFPIDVQTAASVRPTAVAPGTPGWFTAGNPLQAVAATIPGADWFNDVQANLLGVIAAAGVTPTKGAAGDGDLTTAIRRVVVEEWVNNSVLLTHELPAATNGQNFSLGSWQQCHLTYERMDTGGHAALANHAFTLQPGAWLIEARLHIQRAYNVYAQTRLRNTTDGVTVLASAYGRAPVDYSITLIMTINGVFSIGAPKTLQIELTGVKVDPTKSGDMLQPAPDFGESAMVSTIFLRRIGDA